ncbi:MAG TPA: glycosyl hydrolase family 28 protein [Bryobacteraceae bacterium]|nr:glycosyl hydrolase family 28 protein [Bryobacteraceae bacterium]
MIQNASTFCLGMALITSAYLCPAPAASRTASKTAAHEEITAALPVIPTAKFNLTDFGGVGDNKTLNTEAFQKAVAAIAKAGGGHLIVPPGIYKTLPFTLTSHMDLHLDAGATIKAPETFAEYGIPDPSLASPQPPGERAFARSRVAPLISCPENTTDLSITGSGTIDGSGAIFWMWSDKAARRYPPGRAIVGRPMLVVLRGVQRLLVDGVTLTNSPMFHLVPRGQDITIQNVRIVAPSDAPNTDAIDPGGERIVIRNSEIDTGDDDVAIQSGSKDVLIENLTCLHGHGISIGSGTRAGLSHVIVRHCTFDGADNGLRIKSYRGNGGEVHDIRYSDIVMKNVRRPFDINMLYNGNANTPTDVGPREAKPGQTQNIPNFHDIHITNLTVTRSPLAGRILGIPEQPARDITFTNIKIQSVRGFLLQDAKDITFKNAQITTAVGGPLVLNNASVNWNGSEKSGTSGGSPEPFY